MNTKLRLIVGCIFLLTGCVAPHYTAFAPLTPRLEPTPYGGTRYLVCVNTGGKDLHNVSGSVYIWNTRIQRFPQRKYTHRMYFSCPKWGPAQVMRARHFATPMEEPISEPVSAVEIIGQCDEGYFRELWVNTENDQLQSASPVAQGSY
jgi:hypothetical protein